MTVVELTQKACTVGGESARSRRFNAKHRADFARLSKPTAQVLPVHRLQYANVQGIASMSLVRLLGFTTLACGCVSGKYREVATSREVTYIEEKGASCGLAGHQRNQPVSADRVVHGFGTMNGAQAS